MELLSDSVRDKSLFKPGYLIERDILKRLSLSNLILILQIA